MARTATADVTVTAAGTRYVLDDDVAFVTVSVGLPARPTIVRVPNGATASGVLTTFTVFGDVGPDRTITIDFADLEYLWRLACDAGRDELVVGDQREGTAVYVIADASTAVGTLAPDRTLGGATNPLTDPSQISCDAANDRLAVVLTSDPQGFAVIDDVSTRDGDVAPDRLVPGPSLPLAYSFGGSSTRRSEPPCAVGRSTVRPRGLRGRRPRGPRRQPTSGVRNRQRTPVAFASRTSSVTSGTSRVSARATYQAS